MAEQVYEGMFILDSNHYAKDAAGTSGGVTEIIEKNGGEILASRLWNLLADLFPHRFTAFDGHQPRDAAERQRTAKPRHQDRAAARRTDGRPRPRQNGSTG